MVESSHTPSLLFPFISCPNIFLDHPRLFRTCPSSLSNLLTKVSCLSVHYHIKHFPFPHLPFFIYSSFNTTFPLTSYSTIMQEFLSLFHSSSLLFLSSHTSFFSHILISYFCPSFSNSLSNPTLSSPFLSNYDFASPVIPVLPNDHLTLITVQTC